MIERTLETTIREKLFQGRAILLTGPRQVGKTTLLSAIVENSAVNHQFLDGDDPTVRDLLNEPNTEDLRSIIGNAKLIFIDEAQRIPNIGLTAKIVTDQFPESQLILSGSSSFELAGFTQEALTGRKWPFEIFPVSWEEWEAHVGYVKAEQDLENRLIFGFYPEILTHPNEQKALLRELVDSYLYKDVLAYSNIRKPGKIEKLTQALAYQVGQEITYKELGDVVGMDPKTVEQYIDILEKGYVVFRLGAFSRNLRNEIKNNRKIFFYDNGVRNAVIGAFQPLKNRRDIGALWENFLISERIKQLKYHGSSCQSYFWRTKQQQEVDYVEEGDGRIGGYEFKWNSQKAIRFPKTFKDQYDAEVKGIHRKNFREFVNPD